MKTWKQKIGKRLLKHVKETTTYDTLREVKNNLASQKENRCWCYECSRIAQKLSLNPEVSK